VLEAWAHESAHDELGAVVHLRAGAPREASEDRQAWAGLGCAQGLGSTRAAQPLASRGGAASGERSAMGRLLTSTSSSPSESFRTSRLRCVIALRVGRGGAGASRAAIRAPPAAALRYFVPPSFPSLSPPPESQHLITRDGVHRPDI